MSSSHLKEKFCQKLLLGLSNLTYHLKRGAVLKVHGSARFFDLKVPLCRCDGSGQWQVVPLSFPYAPVSKDHQVLVPAGPPRLC